MGARTVGFAGGDRISAVFFDLDNTLIETRKADKIACNKLADILSEKYEIPREVSTAICNNYLRAFRKCPENPNMGLDDWRLLLWEESLGPEYDSIANEVYRKWLHLRYRHLALAPGTVRLLADLKRNYLLGLITNGPSRAQWEKVRRLDLGDRFDIILVSGDLPWEKPNHRIFERACAHLNVKPGECLMVGDKLETDILGGIEAKLAGTVWIPLSEEESDGSGKQFRPDYVIDNVTELAGLLPGRHEKGDRKTSALTGLDIEDSSSNASDGS